MLVGKVEGYFNEVLSGYHGYLKEIQRVFEEKKISKKVSCVLQECFNEVLFCHFFLHDTNRSYPSRRRACFQYSNCDCVVDGRCCPGGVFAQSGLTRFSLVYFVLYKYLSTLNCFLHYQPDITICKCLVQDAQTFRHSDR